MISLLGNLPHPNLGGAGRGTGEVAAVPVVEAEHVAGDVLVVHCRLREGLKQLGRYRLFKQGHAQTVAHFTQYNLQYSRPAR
jgi:hypothetical protein